MHSLSYVTSATDRHSIYIATWIDNGVWWTKFIIDGVVTRFESLGSD